MALGRGFVACVILDDQRPGKLILLAWSGRQRPGRVRPDPPSKAAFNLAWKLAFVIHGPRRPRTAGEVLRRAHACRQAGRRARESVAGELRAAR